MWVVLVCVCVSVYVGGVSVYIYGVCLCVSVWCNVALLSPLCVVLLFHFGSSGY